MSMMTSYMLCTVEHRLKQACRDTISNIFCNKFVLLVGDLAQLPAICVHASKAPNIIYRCCHISSAPCWTNTLQHKLQISVCHASDPTYLQFLNIIRDRKPIESEIEATLSTCFVNELELTGHIHADTTILCSHRQDVMMCNDIVFNFFYYYTVMPTF